jgi:hypothetical protein
LKKNHDNEYDEMDAILARLPRSAPPRDLALRITRTIHKQRQLERIGLFMSIGLVLIGIWIGVPSLVRWLNQLSMPSTGLPLIVQWIGVSMEDTQGILNTLYLGFTNLQSYLYNSGVSLAWIGLIILGLGAFFVVKHLLTGFDCEIQDEFDRGSLTTMEIT